MKCITLAQLIEFHRRITIKTGGSDGVRDKGLLESALNRPFATFSGEDLYKCGYGLEKQKMGSFIC